MNIAIDIIMSFLKNWNSYEENGKTYEYLGTPTDKYDAECIDLWAPRYLLNQIIRQIPVTKRYVSDEAQNLWKQLTYDDIWKYNYQDKVTVTKNKDAVVKKYNGASKNPVNKDGEAVGNDFIFRDVFHDEHIIPIAVIIDNLLKLKESEITPEKIKEIIDEICICRITKEEDRKITVRSERPFNLLESYEKIYIENQVVITDLEEALKNQN